MALVPLKFPPGVVRPGTVYDARGRWYTADFVRWRDGVMQPMGGWSVLPGAGGSAVNGPVRGMLAWRKNFGTTPGAPSTVLVAIATHAKLFVYNAGTLTDVTPAGHTPGSVDASGNFYQRTEATTWQLDSFGQDMVAVSLSDGDLYYYNATANSVTIPNGAPTNNVGVVVTPERFIVTLGADGDRRKIRWADQETNDVWDPAVDNQAGDLFLPGNGQAMAGRRGRNETLIWSDTALFSLKYIGGAFVYSLGQLGSECGAISRHAMGMIDGRAFWMGQNGFYAYDGYVKAVPSEVSDHVFGRLNRAQASKIACQPLSDYGEVWWYYPAGSSTENDSAVCYNYLGNFWMVIDNFSRTHGIDRGFLEFPLAGSSTGAVYEHEKGTTYLDEGSATPYVPNAESGPFELGEGDNVMMARAFIPDEKSLGQVNVRLIGAFYPTAAETTYGPFTLANPTDFRVTARQVRVKITQTTANWRWGTPRIDVVPGGER